MHKRHRQLIARIFAEPTPQDIRWTDIESLLVALGAEVSEGSGSRVRIALNGVRAVFHRPHGSAATKRGAVRALRDFLTAAGTTPAKDRQDA
jgi:hypothetical protein